LIFQHIEKVGKFKKQLENSVFRLFTLQGLFSDFLSSTVFAAVLVCGKKSLTISAEMQSSLLLSSLHGFAQTLT
jgi:hypothetical protein